MPRILVVDYDPQVLKFLTRALFQEGYDVTATASGRDAEVLRFHPRQARQRYCSTGCREAARKWSRWKFIWVVSGVFLGSIRVLPSHLFQCYGHYVSVSGGTGKSPLAQAIGQAAILVADTVAV